MWSANLQKSLSILRAYEAGRVEAIERAYALLTKPLNADRVKRFVVPTAGRLQWTDSRLLQETARIVREHEVRWAATDWPFENFWGIPHEPRHSKLLRYFIDPKEGHGCGMFLLRELLAVLGFCLTVDENCQVSAERAYIDLLITREPKHGSKGKYAIVVENKIRGAKDRDEQLKTYYEKMKAAGFEKDEVYVVYLPLTHRSPSQESRGDVPVAQIRTKTFEHEISIWLCKARQAVEVIPQMRDNLTHYSNLLEYLLKRERAHPMYEEMLKRLEDAETNGTLPGWQEIEALQKSATELANAYLLLLRLKLLRDLRDRIAKKEGPKPVFICKPSGTFIEIEEPSDYRSALELCVGVRSSGTLMAAIGIDQIGQIYIGYLPQPGSTEGAEQERSRQYLRSKGLNLPKDQDSNWWGYEYWEPKQVVEAYPGCVGDIAARMMGIRSEIEDVLCSFQSSTS